MTPLKYLYLTFTCSQGRALWACGGSVIDDILYPSKTVAARRRSRAAGLCWHASGL
ncbi:MAG TPA: hypothetical protein VK253_07830 [Candidatus Binatia bacterium]|nr:hypothetical protein [Candidatus Binatia bacterium]